MRVMNREAEAEMITEQAVLSALATIQDPDLRRDIVSLGFVNGLRIDGGTVAFAIELTTPAWRRLHGPSGAAVIEGVVNGQSTHHRRSTA